MAVSAAYGSLPSSEQIAFFRRKLNLPTESWTDIYGAEHDWSFVVAGANRNDLLADLRGAVEAAIADGETLQQFRTRFADIVQRHGWSYNGGEGWRSRVIYDTNLRTSYAAGRFNQLMALSDTLPFWEYQHSDAVEHPRELHLAWDGMILRFDDPWWITNFPPNGWGCQCGVVGRSWDDLRRLGKSGPDTAPDLSLSDQVIGQRSPNGPRIVTVPDGVDPGFAHTPGRSRLDSQTPPPASGDPLSPAAVTSASGPGVPWVRPTAPLPAPRPAASPLLATGLAEADYASAFLARFGATLDKPAIFRDVLGEPLVVGSELFTNRKTGELKITKRGREKFLLQLADAIREPDEIWTRIEWYFATKSAVVRRRYIARFVIEGEAKPALAVFEFGGNGWSGVTTFAPDDNDYLENLRIGVRVYRRGE